MITIPSAFLELRNSLNFDCVSIGKSEFTLHPTDKMLANPIGYMLDDEGTVLLPNDAKASERARWLVIGYDDMEDRMAVDMRKPNLPVYTLPQETFLWKADCLAPSFASLCRFLEEVKKVSAGRDTEEKLKLNPLPLEERARLINILGFEDDDEGIDYWDIWLKGE